MDILRICDILLCKMLKKIRKVISLQHNDHVLLCVFDNSISVFPVAINTINRADWPIHTH